MHFFSITQGDVVSIIAPNASAIFEAHFAVPGASAVLHTINTRLDAATIAYQLKHCHAKVYTYIHTYIHTQYSVVNVVD